MSASHRSLARLPLDIFTNLTAHTEEPMDSETLRRRMCVKLKQVSGKSSSGNDESITTVGELLKMSLVSLLRATDPLLTYYECEELVRRICIACSPAPVRALSLYKTLPSSKMRYLQTGMAPLDACLRGGFRVGMVSEIFGRSSTCKTQLALQLCVVAAKYDLGSVYIDTERKLSLGRLKEMAQERSMALPIPPGTSQMDVEDGERFSYYAAMSAQEQHDDAGKAPRPQDIDPRPFKSARQVLENVTVHTPGSTNELLAVVHGIEEEILLRNEDAEASPQSNCPVGLVVLDSIAAPARREFGKESAPQRASSVLQIAQILKRLADQLQIAIVVINQVGVDGASSESTKGDFVAVQAALGTSWHHCVSTRLLLEHERDPYCLSDSRGDAPFIEGLAAGQIRKATLVKSTDSGRDSIAFRVSSAGLTEVGS